MTTDVRTQNLDRIIALSKTGKGMDILIVSTSNEKLEEFWQKRLMNTLPVLYGREVPVIVISEDWPGGAGNGLGSLYAWHQACQKAKQLYQMDLQGELTRGAAVALYHTAGKGTRLAPLPAAEANNKSGVRLPCLIGPSEAGLWLTILEAVIKQTAVYGPSRPGRLSVFWGDQIFIPSAPVDYRPTSHVDILAKARPLPSKEQWESERLDQYGLVACDAVGNARQVEKVDHVTMERLVKAGHIDTTGGFGISLGSFSLSLPILEALTEEFSTELESRQGKLDSDPHFWMATTLDKSTYLEMRSEKDGKNLVESHYSRMQAFRERFLADHSDMGFFTMVDIGHDCFWWDYGSILSYCHNHLQLTKAGPEASAMRRFFELPVESAHTNISLKGECRLINCQIASGNIEDSILIGVQANHVDVKNGVILNSVAPCIEGQDFLLYNVADAAPIACATGSVRADVFLPGDERHLKIRTSKGRSGAEDWQVKLPENDLSYEGIYELNSTLKNEAIDAFRERVFASLKDKPESS